MAAFVIPKSELASLGSRIFALLIDSVLFALLSSVLYPFARNPTVEGLLSMALAAGLQWYFLTKYNGQTPGKSAITRPRRMKAILKSTCAHALTPFGPLQKR